MVTPTTELIKKYFNYLLDDYGFSIDREEYFPQHMGNADIVYKSQSITILVTVDRSQVLLNIGESSQPEMEWFEFTDVVQYFNPSSKEVYDFSEESLLNQEYIEMQAKRLAHILRQYCEPLLRGDFSMRDQIKENERKRVAVMLEHFKKLSANKRRTGG